MFQDLRYALRTLRRSPGIALIAIISLALGIGVVSAMFSFADAMVLRPMPVPNPSHLVAVQSQLRGEAVGGIIQYFGLSYPDFVDLRDRSKSFEGLAASQYSQFGFATDKSALPQMKFGLLVSWDFFRALDVWPELGRSFRRDEDGVPGRDAVVILGYDLWKTEFAFNPDVIGKTIFLNGVAFTVIGVAPESLVGSNVWIRSSLYIPLAMGPRLSGDPDMLEHRANRVMIVQGRLKPGVSVAQAAAEARVVAQQLAETYPKTNRTCSLVVDTEVQSRVKQYPTLLIMVSFLLTMAAVVLLIACANVTNLMLSRARARSREIAVRLAIGAGRGRLIRQLLIESLVIAVLGGALGLLVAQTGMNLFSQFRMPADLPIVFEARLDPRVLLFTMLACVASTLLFGLAPALQSTKPDLVRALKTGLADGGRRRRLLGRNSLVIAQVAGALLLLVLATQAYRGAVILLSSPAGFRTDHILIASLNPTLARYTPDHTQEFYKRLLEQARVLPEVKSAALAHAVPMLPFGSDPQRVVPEDVQLPPGTEAVSSLVTTVSDGYFGTLNVPILEGREFRATDRADSPRVAIVNDVFARKYYPNQSAIGKRFRLNGTSGPFVQIVGVARKSKYVFAVEPPLDYIYLPLAQNPQPAEMCIMLETTGPSSAVAGPLRDLVRSLDAGQPLFGVRTMEEVFDQRATKTLHILIETVAGMGLVGLVLAIVGLYGLMSYSVSLRAREIGIRMAIGADHVGVLGMILKQGMMLAGVGIMIGLLLCAMASKAAESAFSVPSFNLALVALVATALVVVAALGAYVPARRASLVDPNTVLRQE